MADDPLHLEPAKPHSAADLVEGNPGVMKPDGLHLLLPRCWPFFHFLVPSCAHCSSVGARDYSPKVAATEGLAPSSGGFGDRCATLHHAAIHPKWHSRKESNPRMNGLEGRSTSTIPREHVVAHRGGIAPPPEGFVGPRTVCYATGATTVSLWRQGSNLQPPG